VPKRFSVAALAALAAHDWPGNVRELHFAVERAGLLAENEVIDLVDLPPEIVERSSQRPAAGPGALATASNSSAVAPVPPPPRVNTPPTPPSLPALPPVDDDDFSRGGPDAARVREALEKSRWRREQAAEILGVSPRTLYRWMKRLGL
jgi:transcriptional regulator of acetoin/glycerol metabolism